MRPLGQEERVVGHEHRVDAFPRHRRERGVELGGLLRGRGNEVQAQRGRGGLELAQHGAVPGRGRMPQHRHPRPSGEDVAVQLQAFGADLRVHERDAGDVAAGPGQAGDESVADGISRQRHHDRSRWSGAHGRAGGCRHVGHDDVALELDEPGGQTGQLVRGLSGIAPVDDDVLAFDVAELAQSLPERLRWLGPGGVQTQQDADAPDLPGGGLGARVERRDQERGDQEERRGTSVDQSTSAW